MGLWRRILVLLPELDRLVGLAGQQAAARLIEGGGEDACLALDGPWLHDGLPGLEVVAAGPVPEPAEQNDFGRSVELPLPEGNSML